jgi:glycosidase
MANKPIIYQLIPRLFTNYNANCVPGGTLQQNGSGKLNDITPKVLKGIKELAVTHVWYTGVIEHAHKPDYTKYGIPRHNPHVIKGEAGSPYAITDYYDIDPDLAVDVNNRIKEFENLVERTHDEGLNVIIDFVPNHVARQYHSDMKPKGVIDLGANDDSTRYFAHNNNFYYIPRQQFSPVGVDLYSGENPYNEFPAKASGNDCFNAFPNQNDWYDTVKLNYGVDYGDHTHHFEPMPDTWHKMLDILLYWAGKGVDGFRCDMAHMVPLEFWQWAIPLVKDHHPHIIFIAEIYDVALYRNFITYGHFDYLYDKVTLYDTLRGIQCSNISAARLTSCWQTVEGISANMLNFLENHDEQRFGSKEYAGNPRLVVPSLVVSSMINTGAMMIYAGQELGEQANDAEGYSGHDGRTTIFDYWSLSTLRRWLNNGQVNNDLLSDQEIALRKKYIDILSICNRERAISSGRFFDLMYVNYENPNLNPHRHYAFLRHIDDTTLIIIVNFGDTPSDIKVNIPTHAFDYLDITPGKYHLTELLSGTSADKEISPDSTFNTFVGAYDAVIWKLKSKK